MDANVPSSKSTATAPAAPWSKQGAKPKPQTIGSPGRREAATTAEEGNQGRKLLHPPREDKVLHNFSVLDEGNCRQLGDPRASTFPQDTSGMSPAALEAMAQPALTDECPPVEGRTHSTPSTYNSPVNFTSCVTNSSLFSTARPEISSTPQQTTEDPTAAATPPLSGAVVDESVDRHDKSETPTTKRSQVSKVLDAIHCFPGLRFQMATNKNKQKKNGSTFEDGGIQLPKCSHTDALEQHIVHIRSALDQNEEDLKAARHQVTEMKRHYEDQISRLSAALSQKQQEMQVFGERAHREKQQHDASYISRITSGLQTVFQNVMSPFSSAISGWFGTPDQDFSMAEVHNHYIQELQKMKAALEDKGKEAEYYKHGLSERENYIQRKSEETRTILQQKDEQLKSFKDRVAGDVALSLKTGKAESMNNPVSKSRLKEMYDELRTLWPTIKKHLKLSNQSPETVKAKLQAIFADASSNMEQQKSQIDKLYGLDDSTGRQIYQKVYEYRKATIQYLQLTLYHNRKDEAEAKSSLLQHEGSSLDVMEFLDSQCHWLGILMALNDPPLHPDWENHNPGMNEWDILPRNLRSFTVL